MPSRRSMTTCLYLLAYSSNRTIAYPPLRTKWSLVRRLARPAHASFHHLCRLGLLVPEDRMGPIGLLDCRYLLSAERDVNRREDLLEMLGFSGSSNRRRYARRLQNPGAGNLGKSHTLLVSNLLHRGGVLK